MLYFLISRCQVRFLILTFRPRIWMAEVEDLSGFIYFVLRNAVSYFRLLINSCQAISGCVRVGCLDGLAEGFPLGLREVHFSR